ncbi:ELK3 isoform 4, partial [Pan troglodytes]
RNEYIHSGLYSSFTINSLQNPPDAFKAIKTEKLEEPPEDSPPVEEVRTVIRPKNPKAWKSQHPRWCSPAPTSAPSPSTAQPSPRDPSPQPSSPHRHQMDCF